MSMNTRSKVKVLGDRWDWIPDSFISVNTRRKVGFWGDRFQTQASL